MTYRGYDLRFTQDGRVAVHQSGRLQYVAKTMGQAKRWVNGYKDGVTWAVVEKLAQDKLRALLSL
jgi:hypothetical protein